MIRRSFAFDEPAPHRCRREFARQTIVHKTKFSDGNEFQSSKRELAIFD